MSFLAPLFFAGLTLLAIPVLIHLIQRERKNVVPFPSLMFVRRIPYSSIRRRRIHNWALLAHAAGRAGADRRRICPAVSPQHEPGCGRGRVARCRDPVGPLLQHGAWRSMGASEARGRRRRVGGLAEGDRATLVTFATSAEVAVQGTNDKGRLQSEIGNAQLSAGATRFGPGAETCRKPCSPLRICRVAK